MALPWRLPLALVGAALTLVLAVIVQFTVCDGILGFRSNLNFAFDYTRRMDKAIENGRVDKALGLGRDGLERFPENALLLDHYADALVLAGRPEEAVGFYERLIERGATGYWEPWMKLARIHEGAGRTEEAIAVYEDLLGHYPGHMKAKATLRRLQTSPADSGPNGVTPSPSNGTDP